MSAAQPPAFAMLLRQYRREAGLTQEELAERAGLSARGVSDLERGLKRTPHPFTVQQLANALQLSPEERATLENAVSQRRGPPRAHAEEDAVPLRAIPTSLVGREQDE